MEDLDDARDCLRECAEDSVVTTSGSTESLLTRCLDESTDEGSAVESLDGLVECCSFDSDCERDLEDAQDCLEFCLDSCVGDQAEEYLDCIRGAAEDSDCDLDECIDGFLSDDIEDDLEDTLGDSEDIFSLSALEGRIVRIDEEELEDCGLLAEFIDSACEIGQDCCDECEGELAVFLDCLVNDIVIPFVSIERNTTIDTCPIDTDDCELITDDEGSRKKRRRAKEHKPLSLEEEQLFQRALSLPSKKALQNKRSAKREAMITDFKKAMTSGRRLNTGYNTTSAIAACEATMRMNIVAANMTHAMNEYTECVSVAAIETLALSGPSESGASMTSFASALVAAVGVMALFF